MDGRWGGHSDGKGHHARHPVKRLALVAIVLLAVTEIPNQTPIPEDAYGIWQVPCISMSLPIYEEVGHNGQQLIDNDNSGCLWHYGRS